MSGYLERKYAEAFSEWGSPLELPQCGGWLLKRRIPETPYYDAMGCYPLFACKDWSKLDQDLDHISEEITCVSLVTDPFGTYDEAFLRKCFHDIVHPFKTHYIIDLTLSPEQVLSTRTFKRAQKALDQVRIEICDDPVSFADSWFVLYQHLIQRHEIKGLRAFSKKSFLKQLRVPGCVVIQAYHQDELVGAKIFYLQGEVVHSHLAGSTPKGYQIRASYAIDLSSINYFCNIAKWIDQGGGAGLCNNENDGLSQYKQHWVTDKKSTYFCGRIINQKLYSEVIKIKDSAPTDYFPAYRQGEFN